jgi:hypothetical protein
MMDLNPVHVTSWDRSWKYLMKYLVMKEHKLYDSIYIKYQIGKHTEIEIRSKKEKAIPWESLVSIRSVPFF